MTEPTSPAPPPVATAPPTARSNVKAWIVGGVVLVIALCCGGVGIAALIGGDGGDPTAVASPTPARPASPATTPSTADPTTAAPATTVPSPTRTTPAPRPKAPSYRTLSERQWKLVAKNPDAHIGKTYVVFGKVTQFDAATGVDTFRADVAHRRMASEYDYETNTLLSGDADELEDVVEDDIFRADVTVLGSFSYDTQIGGETTVPLLSIDSIKIL
ncbi:hypothetical protein KIF24_13345 [Micromonospora sp. Llam7]|uniref:hypothetical protein n=1 Tax=Micromonospora tarapacensis TaxID=2835305 RepID=UPI001C82AAF5|nr:hypothetical protein [Micromonospora tarapacensis]MBX7266915.1 hypothetical protein [Micromonospora tarapacensis]